MLLWRLFLVAIVTIEVVDAQVDTASPESKTDTKEEEDHHFYAADEPTEKPETTNSWLVIPGDVYSGKYVNTNTVWIFLGICMGLIGICLLVGCVTICLIRCHYRRKADDLLEAIELVHARTQKKHDPSPFAVHKLDEYQGEVVPPTHVRPVERVVWPAAIMGPVLNSVADLAAKETVEKAIDPDVGRVIIEGPNSRKEKKTRRPKKDKKETAL